MKKSIEDSEAAQAFAALGNETRLRILRLLVKAGTNGLNVGDLQRLTQVPASTLAHHLSTLAGAGVVRQEKQGREVVNFADFRNLRRVSGFLLEDCCAGNLASAGASPGRAA